MHFGLVVSHTKSRSLFGHKSLKASVQWTTLKMHHNEVIEHHFQDQFAWVCVRLWMMNLEEKKWLIASSLEFAKKIFAGWATFEKRKKKDMKDKTWMMVRVVSGFFVWCENLFAFRLCKTLEGEEYVERRCLITSLELFCFSAKNFWVYWHLLCRSFTLQAWGCTSSDRRCYKSFSFPKTDYPTFKSSFTSLFLLVFSLRSC